MFPAVAVLPQDFLKAVERQDLHCAELCVASCDFATPGSLFLAFTEVSPTPNIPKPWERLPASWSFMINTKHRVVFCVTTFCWLRVGSIPWDDGDSLGRAFSGPGFLLNHQLVTWEVYSYKHHGLTRWKWQQGVMNWVWTWGNMPKIQKHAILVKQAHKHACS